MTAFRSSVASCCMLRTHSLSASITTNLTGRVQLRLLTLDTVSDLSKALPDRQTGFFLPRLGQVVSGRYEIIDKLAHGRHSTIWLARDHSSQEKSYVGLRVCSRSREHEINQRRQLNAHQILDSISSDHRGRRCIEHHHDDFSVEGPAGTHICFSQPLITDNLSIFQEAWGSSRAVANAKNVFRRVFEGLDYLHTEAKIVHTDLRFETITFPLINESSAERAEEIHHDPKSAWRSDDQITAKQYATYSLYTHDAGPAILSDLGEARVGTSLVWSEYVQPNIMRAPEVELHMDWTPQIDVWNAACLLWAVVECRYSFREVDPSKIDRIYDEKESYGFTDYVDDLLHYDVHESLDPRKYLSAVVSVCGPPPRKFLDRVGPYAHQFFDESGSWLHQDTHPICGNSSIAALSRPIYKREGRDDFLDLMMRALSWLPEDRPTAGELARHPFFLR